MPKCTACKGQGSLNFKQRIHGTRPGGGMTAGYDEVDIDVNCEDCDGTGEAKEDKHEA